jgi:hypothetical protein
VGVEGERRRVEGEGGLMVVVVEGVVMVVAVEEVGRVVEVGVVHVEVVVEVDMDEGEGVMSGWCVVEVHGENGRLTEEEEC